MADTDDAALVAELRRLVDAAAEVSAHNDHDGNGICCETQDALCEEAEVTFWENRARLLDLAEEAIRLRGENDALRTVNDEALKAACADNARLRAEVDSLTATVGTDKESLRREIGRLVNENCRLLEIKTLQGESLQQAHREVEALRRVRDAAEKWWLRRRPRLFSEQDHRDNPLVNIASDAERDLALAVCAALDAAEKPSDG